MGAGAAPGLQRRQRCGPRGPVAAIDVAERTHGGDTLGGTNCVHAFPVRYCMPGMVSATAGPQEGERRRGRQPLGQRTPSCQPTTRPHSY
jgi:hypothetical protein